jgi:ketosteroid isomerase-like protein
MELAKDNSNEYINYIKANNANSTRIVGVETVTTTMYRCIKENYVVYLKLKNISDLTSKGITTVQAIDDLTSNDGTTLISKDDTLIRITIGENQNINQILKNNFNQIKNSTFYEFIGEYQIKTGEGVTTENKQTYRVITYVEI